MASDENKIYEDKTKPGAPRPPKWKSAVLVFVAIYPMILFLPGLLEPIMKIFPAWLGRLFSLMIAVVLMTWIVMPVLTRLFEKWLEPQDTP